MNKIDKKYLVYLHINRINNKMYVGITSRTPENRWGKNGCNYSTSPKFYAAINKYGWNNFEHEILETGLSKEEACLREQYYIQKFNFLSPNGYNLTSGGEMTEMSDEARKKLSKSMMGNKNGLGHKCSEEKKKKISDAQKGKTFTKEHKRHISEAKKGKKVGPCSEEKRQRIIASKKDKKAVYCVETNMIYESIQECARQLGLQATLICKVCKGKAKTTGGYHFQYYIHTH